MIAVRAMTERREEVFTVEEVARLLKATPRTVRDWIYAGKLKSFKVGQQHRIRQSALDQFIREGEPNVREGDQEA